MNKNIIFLKTLIKLAMSKDETVKVLSKYIEEVENGFLKKKLLPNEFKELDDIHEKSKTIKKIYDRGEKFGFSFANYKFDIDHNDLTIKETKFSPENFFQTLLDNRIDIIKNLNL